MNKNQEIYTTTLQVAKEQLTTDDQWQINEMWSADEGNKVVEAISKKN